jgi:hypothetical protein
VLGSNLTASARHSERVDDRLRDAIRRLVRDKEDLPRQGYEAYVRTGFQDGPLMGRQSTIAGLLGVYHPRRHTRLTQSPGGVVIPMQPTEVLTQCSAKIACVVPREIRFELVPAFRATERGIKDPATFLRKAIGNVPSTEQSRIMPRKNADSSLADKLMPSNTTGPVKPPETTIS